MSVREVVFLGTASQVPTRTRNHNALMLLWDDLGILFDPGEGTQRQMTLAGLRVSQITHIAITHFHGDHCLGLAGIIQRLSLDGCTHPVEILYPASGQVFFERLRFASIYHDRTHLIPRPIAPGETTVGTGETWQIQSQPLEHGIDCIGYRLQERDGRRLVPQKLETAGIRGAAIRELVRTEELLVGERRVRLQEVSEPRPGQSMAVIMDTRPCVGASQLANGVDLLVCESTYLSSETEEAHAHYHMTARGAAQLAQQAGVRRLALTHFSQRYPEREPFAEEAASIHTDVAVAEDLARIAVPRRPS